MAEDILQLSTAHKRRKVEIDGKQYEVLAVEELNLADALSIQELARELEKASKTFTGETGNGAEQLVRLNARICVAIKRCVPDLPDALTQSLTDTQRLRLVTYFFEGRKPPAAPAPEIPKPAGVSS